MRLKNLLLITALSAFAVGPVSAQDNTGTTSGSGTSVNANPAHGSGEPPTMNHGPGENSKKRDKKDKRAKQSGKASTEGRPTNAPSGTSDTNSSTGLPPGSNDPDKR